MAGLYVLAGGRFYAVTPLIACAEHSVSAIVEAHAALADLRLQNMITRYAEKACRDCRGEGWRSGKEQVEYEHSQLAIDAPGLCECVSKQVPVGFHGRLFVFERN